MVGKNKYNKITVIPLVSQLKDNNCSIFQNLYNIYLNNNYLFDNS